MHVRKARVEEAQGIIDLHVDTVRRVNSRDYSPEQIDAWLGRRRVEVTEAMIRDGQYYVCVDDAGHLLGLGNIKGNELVALYVSADHQGEGVGSAIVRRIEEDAFRDGISQIKTDSTVTAEGFYRRQGYVAVERKVLNIARGQTLQVVAMTKKLKSEESR
ncbi:MAG TPA: GNAT family N-acetyltransferase [Phycisphaerae bacterium]|nr:GNAT family N-acetyltransferase [Phycisphaerae bacterium]